MKLKNFFYKILLLLFFFNFMANADMHNRKDIMSVTLYNFHICNPIVCEIRVLSLFDYKIRASLIIELDKNANCNSFYCPKERLHLAHIYINDFVPDVFLTKSYYDTPENADNDEPELEICFTDGSCNRWNRESYPQEFKTLYDDMQMILMDKDDLPYHRSRQLHTKAIFEKKDLT